MGEGRGLEMHASGLAMTLVPLALCSRVGDGLVLGPCAGPVTAGGLPASWTHQLMKPGSSSLLRHILLRV